MSSWFRSGSFYTRELFEFVVPLPNHLWYTINPSQTYPDETARFGFRHVLHVGVDKGGPVFLDTDVHNALIAEPEFHGYSLQRRKGAGPAISFETATEAVSFKLRWACG